MYFIIVLLLHLFSGPRKGLDFGILIPLGPYMKRTTRSTTYRRTDYDIGVRTSPPFTKNTVYVCQIHHDVVDLVFGFFIKIFYIIVSKVHRSVLLVNFVFIVSGSFCRQPRLFIDGLIVVIFRSII